MTRRRATRERIRENRVRRVLRHVRSTGATRLLRRHVASRFPRARYAATIVYRTPSGEFGLVGQSIGRAW